MDSRFEFAFLGAGSMGGAIAAAACKAAGAHRVAVSDPNGDTTTRTTQSLGCAALSSNTEAAENARFVLLCVKPQAAACVLGEIAPVLAEREKAQRPAILVSIAAGLEIKSIRELTSPTQPIIRLMPNNPVLIGRGMVLTADDGVVSREDAAALKPLLDCCGTSIAIPEKLMDAGTAAASCSPAFVYMFIEALADGGVRAGLSRPQALELAAAAVEGSAAMVRQSGLCPAQLKDMVCSPAGSTIEGVAALERAGFRSSVIEAVTASYAQNAKLGK